MAPERFIDAVLSLPVLGRVLLAPDGRHVAWTWYRLAPAADIFVAPCDGSTLPRRLTRTADDSYLLSWIPDGSGLVIAEDQGGDERYRLFRLGLDGALSPLTEPSPAYFPQGGEIDVSGRYLVFGANLDPATGKTLEASWIIRQDLATGERLALARPEKPNNLVPRLDRRGSRILYTRRDRDPAGTQLWLVGLDGEEDREILNLGPAVKTSGSWFPDSRRVLVIAEGGAAKRVAVHNTATGGLHWLVDDERRNIETAFVPWVGDRIIAVEVRDARSRGLLIDPASGAIEELTTAEGSLLPMGPAADGAWIGRRSEARQPDTVVRFAIEKGGVARPLSALAGPWSGSPLRRDMLTEAEDVRWRSVDGLEIQG
jgi:hypothetical protein